MTDSLRDQAVEAAAKTAALKLHPSWDETGPNKQPYKDGVRAAYRGIIRAALPSLEPFLLAQFREALKGPVERLERIRDLDEQLSDGSLGSLARYALDELAALDHIKETSR